MLDENYCKTAMSKFVKNFKPSSSYDWFYAKLFCRNDANITAKTKINLLYFFLWVNHKLIKVLHLEEI